MKYVWILMLFHLNSYQIAHIFHNYYRLEDMKQTNSKHVFRTWGCQSNYGYA